MALLQKCVVFRGFPHCVSVWSVREPYDDPPCSGCILVHFSQTVCDNNHVRHFLFSFWENFLADSCYFLFQVFFGDSFWHPVEFQVPASWVAFCLSELLLQRKSDVAVFFYLALNLVNSCLYAFNLIKSKVHRLLHAFHIQCISINKLFHCIKQGVDQGWWNSNDLFIASTHVLTFVLSK